MCLLRWLGDRLSAHRSGDGRVLNGKTAPVSSAQQSPGSDQNWAKVDYPGARFWRCGLADGTKRATTSAAWGKRSECDAVPPGELICQHFASERSPADCCLRPKD
jgi:hypothetical protein